MKCWILLPVWFLLPWTLAQEGEVTDPKITVKTISDGIVLSCGTGNKMSSPVPPDLGIDESLKVPYKDENSGEYQCLIGNTGGGPKIYVKFRSCENCVELDVASIVGMVIGNIVATIVIGVAVYLIASQNRISPVAMDKKRSDRQHLIPHESSSRAPNDHYQPLNHKGKKDTYDVLSTNRR